MEVLIKATRTSSSSSSFHRLGRYLAHWPSPVRHFCSAPGEVDWRKRNVLTDVRKQTGNSCWANATSTCFEAARTISGYKLEELSVKHLVDNVPQTKCGMSHTIHALNYISRFGQAFFADYDCQPIYKLNLEKMRREILDGWLMIPPNDEEAMRIALEHQPVIAAVHASKLFKMYRRGTYKHNIIGYIKNKNGVLEPYVNHAVAVVGYGKDENGNDIWYAQNSWGPHWGMKGCINIRRNHPFFPDNLAYDAYVPYVSGVTHVLDGSSCPIIPPPVCLCKVCRPDLHKGDRGGTIFGRNASEHDELEAKFFEERAALEAKYQKLYAPLYSKRYDIVNGVEVDGANDTAMDADDKEGEEKGVPSFWLNAMKNNEILAEEISERDEEALKYLKDIKWCRIDDPKGFKLEFFFDTNPFFKNSVLTKTYHMIDDDEPILEKAIGTDIEWLPGKCLTQKILKKKPKKGSKNAKPITKTEDCESFFNFFNPPQVPDDEEDIDEEQAEELQNQMEQDYDIGSTIRDKIIPHAVSWFTGEAAEEDEFEGIEDDDEDIDDDEDEDDEDDDEEEDDDEDEEETKGRRKKSSGQKKGGIVHAGGEQGERPPECKQQ